jgi:hypothetical protein
MDHPHFTRNNSRLAPKHLRSNLPEYAHGAHGGRRYRGNPVMSRTYLQRLIDDSRVVELRHATGTRWESGHFDNFDALVKVIRERAHIGNLYTTLNRPAIYTASNAMGCRALRDDDIAVITRLPFDLDPIRPADTPATDDEHGSACEARELLVRMLSAYGWPTPALGMSGNGAHALYRVRVRATPGWRKAVAVLYAGLRDRTREPFDEMGVTFDATVRNPARIWRLYGTVNRKGQPTDVRPHRRAEITLPAGPWQIVSADVLKRTVSDLEPAVVPKRTHTSNVPIEGRGDYSTLDVVAWFRAHAAYRRELGDGKHAVDCPWADEHTTTSATGTDTVVWETGASGWPTFHCSHAHCDDRSILDVIQLRGDADRFCTQEWRHG